MTEDKARPDIFFQTREKGNAVETKTEKMHGHKYRNNTFEEH